MLPAFMLLVTVMIDNRWPKWPRGVALAACIACEVVRFGIRDWDYRALVFLVEFALVMVALAAVRRNVTRRSPQPELNDAAADRG
jgi:hypothetical protein